MRIEKKYLSFLVFNLIFMMVIFSDVANATDFEISVYPEFEKSPAESALCINNMVGNCHATLVDAINLIQNQKWQISSVGKFSKVRLRLKGGTYRLTQPINLNWGNVGASVPLEIIGIKKQTIVTGGQPVKVYGLASSVLPSRVSAKARGNLWVADVSQFKLDFSSSQSSWGYGIPIIPINTEFFVNDEIQSLAAWPNVGYGRLLKPANISVNDNKYFSIEGRNANDWRDEPDLHVHAYWFWDWAAQSYLVSTKDSLRNQLSIIGKGSPYGIKNGQRLRVENALAELDSPGEWYLDRSTAKLYFWPVKGAADLSKELSVASNLLNINSSTNVTVRDISFEKVRGDAVEIISSNNVVLEGVEIRQTGNRAVVIKNSFNSGVRDSLIEDNGEGGVLLTGGDRKTLKPANNFVERTEIKRFSRLVKTYRFAVELMGVGQRVTSNKISDAPHTAIIFSGNDHVIANNEIFNVVLETNDAGAIYAGRDYTARGTLIENNYLHDINTTMEGKEVKGVYLDDQICGTTVRGNIFARVEQPVFMGGGRDNVVENNLFFYSSPAVFLDARGLQNRRFTSLDPNGTLQKNLDLVPYRSSVYASRYPNLPKIREDDIGAPKYNIVRNNLIVGGKLATIEPIAKTGIMFQKNFETTDDVFIQKLPPENRVLPEHFLLNSESLPVKQGFKMRPFVSLSN